MADNRAPFATRWELQAEFKLGRIADMAVEVNGHGRYLDPVPGPTALDFIRRC